MVLEQAEKMVYSLMKHYSIFDYKFKWMQRREKFRRAGQCDWKKKTIELAPRFVELNTPFVVKRTIIHELAHAIMGSKHGHNKFWKRTAILMGDDGGRNYGKEIKTSINY